MPTRSPEIITRASEVDEDLVPEPWDPRDADSDRSLVAERERYRLQGATDGQGAGIVPAYNLNVADTEAIPQKTKDGWTRGSAGRVLNAQGKYVSRGSDVPRLSFDGEEPGLLVEAGGRTNQLTYSSNFTGADWDNNSDGLTAKSSILKGQTAQEIATSSDTDNINNSGAGVFSSRLESYSIIIEYTGSQDAVTRISIFSDVNDRVAYGEYLWGTDSTLLSIGDSVDKRVLTQNGPNGGKVVRFILRYDPSTDAEGGNGRQVLLFPDRSGNNEAVIFHHAQIEEAPNASSPIVTGGSPVTRSADDYAIFEGGQPSWWNPNEGTLILEWVNQTFLVEHSTRLLASGDGEIFFGKLGTADRLDTKDASSNVATVNDVDVTQSFVPLKAAISLTGSEQRLSLQGSSTTAPHDGSMLGATEVLFSDLNKWIAAVSKLRYIDRALSESTLNRITS